MNQQLFVIVVGTDPTSSRGGIGFALRGYLRALDCAGIKWVSVPTYHPATLSGKWLVWLTAFPKLWLRIRKARNNGVRIVVYSHAGAGISLLREFFVLAFCRALGTVAVLQLHAPEVDRYLANSMKRRLFHFSIAPAMALAGLTPWWQRRLLSDGISKPIFVIPNPLPADWEAKAKMPRLSRPDDGKTVMLSLCRLVPGKGVDLVIEAMPYLPESFVSIIAGDGSLLRSLELRVATLGISHRVRFSGWVTGEEKQRLFDEADLFVLPTTYDSFGMGFLEAMANGLPVVAAEWGAIPDVVPNGCCGELVCDHNPQAIAEAVLRLRDAETRQCMGEEAKTWVLEKFAPCKVGKEIRAMLEQITE